MGSQNLTNEERTVVAACLRAAAEGPFFPDREFSTLFGLTRSEVKAVADRFPSTDEDDDSPTGNDDSWLAINNAFVNLLGYPHRMGAEWGSWINVSPREVGRVFRKWKQ